MVQKRACNYQVCAIFRHVLGLNAINAIDTEFYVYIVVKIVLTRNRYFYHGLKLSYI